VLSRRFWVVVGAVTVAGLAVYGLVAVPVGPTTFGFSLSSSSCGCEHAAVTHFRFPANAFVSLNLSSQYFGAAAEYVLLVNNSAGVEIVYASMETGYSSDNFTGNGINYANVSETFLTRAGGSFTFTLLGVDPALLPPVNAWINGTYHAPIL